MAPCTGPVGVPVEQLCAAGSITNTAARSVFIQELNGGSYTLSGNINDTGTGIKVFNAKPS